MNKPMSFKDLGISDNCNTWLSLADGQMVDLANPVLTVESIVALLRNCCKVIRFGGRGDGTVTVTPHSIHVAHLCETPEAKRWAILHDLHESPFGEIPTPAKRVIGQHAISQATGRFDNALLKVVGLELTAEVMREVKAADVKAMIIEKAYLGIELDDDWGTGITAHTLQIDQFRAINHLPPSLMVSVALSELGLGDLTIA